MEGRPLARCRLDPERGIGRALLGAAVLAGPGTIHVVLVRRDGHRLAAVDGEPGYRVQRFIVAAWLFLLLLLLGRRFDFGNEVFLFGFGEVEGLALELWRDGGHEVHARQVLAGSVYAIEAERPGRLELLERKRFLEREHQAEAGMGLGGVVRGVDRVVQAFELRHHLAGRDDEFGQGVHIAQEKLALQALGVLVYLAGDVPFFLGVDLHQVADQGEAVQAAGVFHRREQGRVFQFGTIAPFVGAHAALFQEVHELMPCQLAHLRDAVFAAVEFGEL